MQRQQADARKQEAEWLRDGDESPFDSFFDHFFHTHQWPGSDDHSDSQSFDSAPSDSPAFLTPPPELKPLIVSIVRAGYRTEAKRNHPDAGGSAENMRNLAKAKGWLEQALSL
jgi:hypothetical protein